MERSLAPRAVALVVLLATAAAGCAGEGARRAARAPATLEGAPEPPPSDAVATESRPRLRHTVTLGQSYGAAGQGGEPVRDGAPPAPVTPVVVVVQPQPAPAYWGWGATGWVGSPGWVGEVPHPGWVHGGSRVPADPAPRPPSPGTDWTPPPSYGPRFPFKTAPADPWR